MNSPPASDGSLVGARVLVVEDEFIIGLALGQALEDAGAEVLGPATSPAEAHALIASGRITCALLDARLGEKSALPIAQRLAALGVPFAMHTGQLPAEISEWPQCRFLSKPAPPRVLISIVAELAGLADVAGSD